MTKILLVEDDAMIVTAVMCFAASGNRTGMIFLIGAVMLITCVEVGRLKNRNIIDEIRMDVM